MTLERALDINMRLLKAWMLRERMKNGIVPDLSDVSLTDAIEASKIVAAMKPIPDPDRPGFETYTCTIEPTRVHLVWFWALQKRHEFETEEGSFW
jgi:hypothetical protein